MSNKIASILIYTAVLMLSTAAFTAAQTSGETPSCASKLYACLDYLNATTTPPQSCCDPLKEAVTNERTCLCSIYNNPDLVKAFHINITQALNLPKLCRIDTGKSPDICKGVAASPSSSSIPSGSGSRSSPGNTATKITGATPSRIAFILLTFGAYIIMFY